MALEHICLDYLAGNTTAHTGEPTPLDAQLAKAGLDDTVKAFDLAFPSAKMSVEVD